MKSISVVIKDKEGLHARPAGMLCKAAKSFNCTSTIAKNGKKADMKKLFAIMGLAVKCGETVEVTCEGPDEEAAIAEIEKLLNG